MSFTWLFTSPAPAWLRYGVLATLGVGLLVPFAWVDLPNVPLPTTAPAQVLTESQMKDSATRFLRAFLDADEAAMQDLVVRPGAPSSVVLDRLGRRGTPITGLVPELVESSLQQRTVTFLLREKPPP